MQRNGFRGLGIAILATTVYRRLLLLERSLDPLASALRLHQTAAAVFRSMTTWATRADAALAGS